MVDRRKNIVATAGIFVLAVILTTAGTAPVSAAVAASDFGVAGFGPLPIRMAPSSPSANTIRNVDTTTLYDTIQDALDDAATLNGHAIEVLGNHFESRVVISKDITLRGMAGNEIVRATADTGTVGDDRGWFIVEDGTDVTVENLTFHGNGFKIFQAWRVKGTATFEGCTFTEIKYEPSGPQYQGTAIALQRNSKVLGCTFSQIGRVGVLLFGPDVTNGVVDGCSYTGKGAGAFFDYGVEIGGGATGTVTNSYFTACDGVVTPGSDEAAAVNISTYFASGTVATVARNTLIDNFGGIQVGLDTQDTSDVTAEFNRIVGNDEGMESLSQGTVVAENNWWGCNAGPGAVGCDTSVGNEDSDPWLILTIVAIPDMILSNETSDVTAALVMNSDDQDTSGMGTVPDDIPVAFDHAGGMGNLAPDDALTLDGAAETVFEPTVDQGTAVVEATVDNQTVSTIIRIFLEPPVGIPSSTPLGLLILLGLIASSGIWILRR